MNNSINFAQRWNEELSLTQALIEGEGRSINEHQTRRSVIDPILDALGWDESLRNPLRQETAIRATSGQTQFLDYLCMDEATGTPKLVVEAKGWTHQPPRPSSSQRANLAQHDSGALIYLGIVHLLQASGDPAPITQDWVAWLEQIKDYVYALQAKYGHAPERVIITNGRWLLIILSPFQVFSDTSKVESRKIQFFDESSIFECHDEIFDYLSQESLCTRWKKIISPDEITSYLKRSDIAAEYRGVAAHVGDNIDPFGPQPRLKIWPAYFIQSHEGATYKVLDKKLHTIFVPNSGSDRDDVSGHLDETLALTNKLQECLEAQLGGELKPQCISSFTGFVSPGESRQKPAFSTVARLDHVAAIIIFVVTGTKSHFIQNETVHSTCRFHSLDQCNLMGVTWQNNGAAFGRVFMSGADYFCGHKDIHKPRQSFCHIQRVEDALCCQSCIFLDECWDQTEHELPCGH